jgi:hypothetical protein
MQISVVMGLCSVCACAGGIISLKNAKNFGFDYSLQ